MTAEEENAAKIERARRRREDELMLLLLLLLGELSRELVTFVRYGRFDLVQESIARNLGDEGVPIIASAMADAHADSFGRFGRLFDASVNRSSAGPRSAVADIYRPQARDMAQAMATSLYGSLVDAANDPVPADATPAQARRWDTPEAIVRRAMEASGYGKLNPIRLELGVERNIVLASNVGFIGAGLVHTANVGRTIGLRHVSVIDARTTVICRKRDGQTLPATDPYWFFNVPPLHAHCRSIIWPVGRDYDELDRHPNVPPDPGYGEMPPGFHALYGVSARGAAAA